jgi:hypothetical protein
MKITDDEALELGRAIVPVEVEGVLWEGRHGETARSDIMKIARAAYTHGARLPVEPTDEQAEELGREICGGNWPAERVASGATGAMIEFAASIRAEQTKIGRAAWLRGARPSGYIGE